jgi:predicted amidophosphoribosyltransferase
VCDEVLNWGAADSSYRGGSMPDAGRGGTDAYGLEGLICPQCLAKLSFVTEPVCAKCGKQLLLASQEMCADCRLYPKSYEKGAAVLNYEEHAQESMIKIKYGKRREYARFYGRLIAQRLGDRIRDMDPQCIMPVPVHPERFIERGYNQAQLLADEVGRCMGIPVERDILVRVRKTAVQKDLGPEERLKNLSEAFGVLYDGEDADEDGGSISHDKTRSASARPVKYDRVLLVDDIYTTGSTIEACTRVLKAAGVRKVYFVTVCIGSDR